MTYIHTYIHILLYLHMQSSKVRPLAVISIPGNQGITLEVFIINISVQYSKAVHSTKSINIPFKCPMFLWLWPTYYFQICPYT
jgi:hypothetical protein